MRLALWGGHRPAVGPALRLRPPPPGFQLLASFCRLRSHPLRLLAICVGALFHFQVDPTHICARPADFFLGDLCIVETTAGGNSLPEALFIAFEVLAGRGVPSAELTRGVGQATIRAQIVEYMRTHMLEDVFRFYHGRLGGGRMRCFFRSFDTL